MIYFLEFLILSTFGARSYKKSSVSRSTFEHFHFIAIRYRELGLAKHRSACNMQALPSPSSARSTLRAELQIKLASWRAGGPENPWRDVPSDDRNEGSASSVFQLKGLKPGRLYLPGPGTRSVPARLQQVGGGAAAVGGRGQRRGALGPGLPHA